MKLKLWELAYGDHQQGLKYQEIADKHGVSVSTVKSWARRYWKTQKVAPEVAKVAKKVADKKHIGAPFGNHNARGHGAPKGNKNAVGNRGGHGSPGRQNNLKHGLYAKIITSTFTKEEADLFNATDEASPLEQITQTLQFLAVREYRMLKLRDSLLEQRAALQATGQGGDLLDDGITIAEKSGKSTHVQKTTERRLTDKILGIENALTQLQQQKIRAIDQKQKILKDMRDAAELADGFEHVEIVDDLKEDGGSDGNGQTK